MKQSRYALTSLLVAGLFFGLIGCGDDEGTARSGISGARYGVIRTDFVSTSIAVLDQDGAIVDPAILSSALEAPGLVAPLSGDVVLANAQRGGANVLNIVDRFGTDVITRYDLETAEILGQLRVAPGNFSTNPHDLAIVDASRAWVSRFSVNLDPSARPADQANDVIEINPTDFSVTGRRVSLDGFTSTTTVQRDQGPVEVEIYARPSLLVLVDDTLVVGLTRVSFGFDAAAPGQVALINVDSAQLTPFVLPETARNCGSVRAVPNANDLVMVACTGFARPLGDKPQIRASSGVYVLRIAGGQAELMRSWEPRDDVRRPLAVNNLSPLSATRFIAVDHGTIDETGDEAFVVNMSTGEATSLFTAGAAFVIGTSSYDPSTGLLLVPDAADATLRRYRDNSGVFDLEASLTFTDDPLPPRRAYLLP